VRIQQYRDNKIDTKIYISENNHPSYRKSKNSNRRKKKANNTKNYPIKTTIIVRELKTRNNYNKHTRKDPIPYMQQESQTTPMRHPKART